MRENQEKQHNVKFTANDEEYRKLSALASVRHMTVPQFCKLTSLGVRSTPAKQVIIQSAIPEEEKMVESEPKEQPPVEKINLSEDDLKVIAEFKDRFTEKNGFITVQPAFNRRLYNFVMRIAEIGNNGGAE